MGFYFNDRYINTDCDDKYIERAMFEVVPLFAVLMIVMNMKFEKMILKIL